MEEDAAEGSPRPLSVSTRLSPPPSVSVPPARSAGHAGRPNPGQRCTTRQPGLDAPYTVSGANTLIAIRRGGG